jgi:hypothetical protein
LAITPPILPLAGRTAKRKLSVLPLQQRVVEKFCLRPC